METCWFRSSILGSSWRRVSRQGCKSDDSASALHSASALKGIFEEHVTKHSLVSPDHRHIILDDDLARAVGVKNPRPGEALSREETLRRLRAGVAWSVSIGGVVRWVNRLTPTNARKGALQPITMAVKTRQGRKTVTIVAGLETFGVDVDDFAEELRKLCAGSASSGQKSLTRAHGSTTSNRSVAKVEFARDHGSGLPGEDHYRSTGCERHTKALDQRRGGEEKVDLHIIAHSHAFHEIAPARGLAAIIPYSSAYFIWFQLFLPFTLLVESSMKDAKAIRKHAAQHDLFNRIHSIAADEAFVHKVSTDWYSGRFDVVRELSS